MLSDVNPPNQSPTPRNRRPLKRLILALGLAGVLVAGTLLTGGHRERGDVRDSEKKGAAAAEEKTIEGSIKPGETISSLLGTLLTPAEIHELAQSSRPVFPLRNICADSAYRLSLVDGGFRNFTCDIDDDEQLVIKRDGDGFSVSREPIHYKVELVTVKGTIDSSLFEAMVKIGESEGLAIRLADIFAWDIDFFKDIQQGDTFEAVVERRYRDGKPAGDGRLLAARFVNQGELYQAFYFQDGDRSPDYYDEKGRSLRKAFLKAPLAFSRISSGYSMRRRHPITRRIRPHPAIDYAAPTGTPIHTVSDGVVTFAAYKRYNGNCVKVRHPNGWLTMYNHMSRFGKGIRGGKKVQQGQVIGYVGTTGLSTGPHLDFRMYKNGAPVNPLKVKSPPARPVSRANMAAFRETVADRVAFMERRPKNTAQATVPSHKRPM